ncbi:AAA family ATPase [Fulvimarina sp. MAC3]|uniref:ATP-dependent nuclease n=1 Tax=Fulvimarina sp. MAC3 TaxID=3148887 RepID=UPI0031FD4685
MRFEGFSVRNYRNIIDSGWIDANKVTAFVGQNEAGKSNLFEALYCLNPIIPGALYRADEDWPVDDWENRNNAKGSMVCKAQFALESAEEIESLYASAAAANDGEENHQEIALPESATIVLYRSYGHQTGFKVHDFPAGALDEEKATEWAKANVPKFVYIHDYEMSGAQVELDELQQRLRKAGNRHDLSNEDQTILIILDLANIDLDDFLQKGQSSEGRTNRSYDKRSASRYLTKQFGDLWQQKDVSFEIEIDGPTLNIFAEDSAIGMPVRLHRRSTGFRWYVSFAWKFTHATKGEYANCVLLLEEPGIHLHFSGQRDLLKVFERLSENNTIMYTTHLASMVDLANPERVRIVESRDHHLAITKGVVSAQRGPMAVIEQSLGITGDQSGLLSNRQVLIVEGGDDAVVLHKLSGLLKSDGKEGLSEGIYLWPAHGAAKTPMYAGFAIGQGWDAGVLLDTDDAGNAAKKKIDELYLSKLAETTENRFRTLLLGKSTGSKKVDYAIEDLFGDDFYRECVNATFGVAIKAEDLPQDGSSMITKRVEAVLVERHGHRELDKRRVMGEMLRRFDTWKKSSDLPKGTAVAATKLFNAVNSAFSPSGKTDIPAERVETKPRSTA